MAKNVDVRISCCANKPVGCFFFGLAETLMNTGNHDIELGQYVIWKIELPVFQDVNLSSDQQAEVRSFVRKLFVELPDLFDFLTQSIGIQSVGLKRRFRVIGNSPVSEAKLAHGFGDVLCS